MVGEAVKERLEDGTGFFPIFREGVFLPYLRGAFLAGKSGLAVGDVADEIEGVEIGIHFVPQDVEGEAVGLHFLEDGAFPVGRIP